MSSSIEAVFKTSVAEGVFGKNLSLVSFERNEDLVGQDQFMSAIVFGTVKVSDGSSYHVVVKKKIPDLNLAECLKSDDLFHNEIIMYAKIVPFLLACHRRGSTDKISESPLLPRYIYGRNRCGEHAAGDLIILENVTTTLRFRLSEERVFLNYEHVVCALRAIAMFHGLSYVAKREDPVGFRDTIADIRDSQWCDDGQWLFKNNTLHKHCKPAMDSLLARDDRYRNLENMRRFAELIEDGDESVRRALRPREPLSVLCHGDFNRNNVMFRYDRAGRPVDTLLFDFGTPRYGSPALDLSFFLYLNTDRRLREAHWDDLLDAYCAALVAAVPPGVHVPGRADLDAEMAASALFGLGHAAFFLPCQMDPAKTMDPAIGTERVADMVQHFVDMGYTKV